MQQRQNKKSLILGGGSSFISLSLSLSLVSNASSASFSSNYTYIIYSSSSRFQIKACILSSMGSLHMGHSSNLLEQSPHVDMCPQGLVKVSF